MKNNGSCESDTLSKICDKTAYLWLPHLSTAGSPESEAAAKWITHSTRLPEETGRCRGQTQPAGCGFREQTGGALRTRRPGSRRLWDSPVCTSVSSPGLKGTDHLYCPFSPHIHNCKTALRPENRGQEPLILEGLQRELCGGTLGRFSMGQPSIGGPEATCGKMKGEAHSGPSGCSWPE